MSITNAIILAIDRIQYNEDYITMARKYDKENPDSTESQIGARISQLVISIAEQHNELLKEIIKEILKGNLKKILKDISKANDTKRSL